MKAGTAFAGFVDLQVNGYLNVSFSAPDLTVDNFRKISLSLFSRGTALFLPTLVTSPESVYERNLPLISDLLEEEPFKSRIPGLHLEGPFLSPEPGAIGAHKSELVRKPDISFLRKLIKLSRGKVKLLTIAAEMSGADKLAKFASSQGIAVSLGHQMAGASSIKKLAAAGAKALTHLGNGLPNSIHRHENPLWPALAEDSLTAMIIPDGNHINAEMIKVFLRAKGVSRLIAVSDVSYLGGLPPGKYGSPEWRELVIEKSGRIFYPAHNCLAGSSKNLFQCMNYLASLNLMSMKDLLAVSVSNPLRMIGMARIPAGIPKKVCIGKDMSFKLLE